jgi:hypothetical protein
MPSKQPVFKVGNQTIGFITHEPGCQCPLQKLSMGVAKWKNHPGVLDWFPKDGMNAIRYSQKPLLTWDEHDNLSVEVMKEELEEGKRRMEFLKKSMEPWDKVLGPERKKELVEKGDRLDYSKLKLDETRKRQVRCYVVCNKTLLRLKLNRKRCKQLYYKKLMTLDRKKQ